jgi:hypothetical protein
MPSKLKHLKLPELYEYSFGVVPNTLEYLDVGLEFNEPLGALPSTLQELVILRDDDYIRCHYTPIYHVQHQEAIQICFNYHSN